MVAEQRFRKDLLYRLNTMELKLPPLRDRREDIPLLAMAFVQEFGRQYKQEIADLSPDVLGVLQAYSWPGNVRELRHVLERAMILCGGEKISQVHLMLEASAVTATDGVAGEPLTLDQIDRQAILERIAFHQGNMKATARSLGLSRSAFYRRIDKYQL